MLYIQVGLVEFTLPLIYSAVYPIIIISRKQELKDKYLRYFKRVVCCCSGSR